MSHTRTPLWRIHTTPSLQRVLYSIFSMFPTFLHSWSPTEVTASVYKMTVMYYAAYLTNRGVTAPLLWRGSIWGRFWAAIVTDRLHAVVGPRSKAVSQSFSKMEPHSPYRLIQAYIYRAFTTQRDPSSVSFLTISLCSPFKTKWINKMSGSEEDLAFPRRGKRLCGHLHKGPIHFAHQQMLGRRVAKTWITFSYVNSLDNGM